MVNVHQPIVQPIHTAIAGRARYKIPGLWGCESLKRYLELQLRAQKDIFQASGSVDTGNLLVIFSPHLRYDQIIPIILNILTQYRQNLRLSPAILPIKPPLIPIISASTLAAALSMATGIIYANNWDESILLNIQKLHRPLFDQLMLGITLLGEPAILLPLCWSLPRLGFFPIRPQQTNLVTNATFTAIGLNIFLKYLFARDRPILWQRLINVDYYSFPSGHAMVSMVTYGMIAYILSQEFPQHQTTILLTTMVLISAIGFSRLYLGVHWLTDVTAGYAIGLLVLAGFIVTQEVTKNRNLAL